MTENRPEWEKEFDEKYVVMSNAGTPLLRYTDANQIKEYIRAEKSRSAEEERNRIAEEVRYKVMGYSGYSDSHIRVEDVLNIINNS